MSEQIKQLNAGVKIGKFEYFNLGSVTIQALAKNRIIPQKDYGDYSNKKPDGILVNRLNKKSPKVIAIIEYKSAEKFKTETDQLKAIRQCNDYAQVLGATFGIVTDTNVSVWINPKSKKNENNYVDEKGYERSFDFIRDDEQQKLSNNFYFNLQKTNQTDIEKFSDEVKETYNLIIRILESDIGENKSDLKKDDTVDPTNLAKSVWQDIYVATGKEPTKCLYNVVELFIFKFLSDLGVLDEDYNFSKIFEKCKNDEKDALEYYAENVRPRIRKLFPSERESGTGLDNTTIINGTIFVENGKAVLANAVLFKKSIEKYEKFGPLKNIDKSFKIRLYEEFLKRDSGVKGMGQFFTPRKIVGKIVEMAKVENLSDGARVCDPFCGVGGFPLEVITERKNKDFIIKDGKLIQNIKYFGFDKGNDSDAERTIILAKANMLIYLSDLVKNNRNLTKEFARVFNETFKLQTGILGTLANVGDKEEDKFDLIITNPPYVTKGSKTLKEEIEEDQEKIDFYEISGTGVESLSIEWIIKKLKKSGKAFIIIPSGILSRNSEEKLRKFIIRECFINGIISLPINTFYTTPQKTYILVITKKDKKEDKQKKPVFTYLVTDIGETLDVDRFDTGKSDLEKAKNLFKMFEGNESYFTTNDKRCKIQDFSKFEEEIKNNWTVDRWWNKEEKIELGIEEQEEVGTLEDFILKISDLKAKITYIEKDIKKLTSDNYNFNDLELEKIIDFSQNTNSSKFTKSFINDNKGDIPVYSATKDEKVVGYGYVKDNLEGIKYFENCLTWNIDGSIGYVFYRKGRFSLSEKVIPLILFEDFEDKIDKNYLKYLLEISSKERGFSYSNKAGKGKIKDINIPFPLNDKGEPDLKMQINIADKYRKIDEIKEELEYLLNSVKNLQVII